MQQQMSEGTIGGGNDEGAGKECPEGQVPKVQEDGTTKCVPIAAETDKNIPPESEVAASLMSGGQFLDAVAKVVKEFNEKMLKEFRQDMLKELAKEQDRLKKEMEMGLRKSLGLEVDPAVHMSDLADFARKLQLETAPHGKRSPATKLAAAGPDGNKDEHTTETSKELNAMFKHYFPEGGK